MKKVLLLTLAILTSITPVKANIVANYWDIDIVDQSKTGEYADTNCVPATFKTLFNAYEINSPSVEDIKNQMVAGGDLNSGVEVFKQELYFDKVNVQSTSLDISGMEWDELVDEISNGPIVVNVDLSRNKFFDVYGFTGHSMLLVGYCEENKYLIFADTDLNDGMLTMWSYEDFIDSFIGYDDGYNMGYQITCTTPSVLFDEKELLDIDNLDKSQLMYAFFDDAILYRYN